MTAAGAIAGGAAAGAAVGALPGAAAGALVGAASYTTGLAVSAIAHTGLGIRGPNDNWCYVEISTGGP